MLQLDQRWDDVVEAVHGARFPEYPRAGRRLATAIASLSDVYNGRRECFSDARGSLAARLAFFLRADLLKTAVLAAECEAAGVRWPALLKLLDVGAGLGAGAFGVLEHLGGPDCRSAVEEVRVIALDSDAAALEAGHELHRAVSGSGLRAARPKVSHEPRRWDARTDPVPAGLYDMIVVSNMLCEIDGEPDAVVSRLLAALSPAGALLIVEPALRCTSRRLSALRDRLTATSAATILAPCTSSRACPALQAPDDWCHEDRSYQPSPGLQRLAQSTGLRRWGLKFSYLSLRHGGPSLGQTAGLVDPYRVVSERLDSKGKLEVMACGEGGKKRLTLLKRSRSDLNRPFERIARGDLVSARPLGSRERIDAETTVQRWSLSVGA